jgi:hypothetical protein
VQCFVPEVAGYDYSEVSSADSQTIGTLSLKSPSGFFGSDDFAQLTLEVTQETRLRTHVKIYPVSSQRWEVPEYLLPRPGGLYNDSEAIFPGFIRSIPSVHSDPFSVQVIRKTGGVNPFGANDVIFNFTNNFVFQDQYIQFVLNSPSDVVASYGFGESTRSTQRLLDGSTYTLWNSDTASADFDKSLYGTHPFVIQVKRNGRANGFFFLNSNAMELTVSNSATEGRRMSIQSTGGLVDMYVFGGPSPVEVIRQYLQVVGRPAMVPFWSLGFHNCRWGTLIYYSLLIT